MFDERPLHFRKFPVLRQAFDRGDFMALRLDGQFHAGVNRLVVQQHGASAAGRAVTDLFRTGKVGMVAQGIEKRHTWFDVKPERLAIYLKRDRNRFGTERFVSPQLFDLLNFGSNGAYRHCGRGNRDGSQTFEK